MDSSSLYPNETYRLFIRFTDEYPFSSPEIKFCLPAPLHPHIYSNGHICLNILYDDWTPALTVHSVCMSLLSMLASCTHKELPPDNMMYTMMTPHEKNPKNTRFSFEDSTV